MTRTRWGARSRRPPSIVCVRTTMRSLRSRSSRASTKPRDGDVPGRAAAAPDGRPCGVQRRYRKAGRRARQRPAPAESRACSRRAANGDRDGKCGEHQRRPGGRFALGGEIESDAGAVSDREPRQQPPGAGFERGPFAKARGNNELRPRTERAPHADPRCARAADRPGRRAGHGSRAWCPALSLDRLAPRRAPSALKFNPHATGACRAWRGV